MVLGLTAAVFATTAWCLIGGVLSLLAPGLLALLSIDLFTRLGGGGGGGSSSSIVGLEKQKTVIVDRESPSTKVKAKDDNDSSLRETAAVSIDGRRGHRRGAESQSQLVSRGLELFEDDRPGLTVVLDLDETLVRSCEDGDVPVHLECAATMGMLVRLEVQCLGVSGPQGRVVSFLRPHLFSFLEQVSKLADVYIFTAGDPDYARPLVQLLDADGEYFVGSYFRETTVATSVHEHVKDLSRLGVDLRRTVLVDNNPYSFLLQPDNGILCEPFYGEADDGHLMSDVLPLLQLLARVPDVRPILRRRYNLAGWCRTLEEFCD